jgi:hypothetical protein
LTQSNGMLVTVLRKVSASWWLIDSNKNNTFRFNNSKFTSILQVFLIPLILFSTCRTSAIVTSTYTLYILPPYRPTSWEL